MMLVGLDRHRARRREQHVGEAGLDVERLAHRRAVQRAGVVRDRGCSSVRVARTRAAEWPRGRRCASTALTVPGVERLAPPEVGARRVDGEHDAVGEPGPAASCRGWASSRSDAGAPSSRRRATGTSPGHTCRPSVVGDRRHDATTATATTMAATSAATRSASRTRGRERRAPARAAGSVRRRRGRRARARRASRRAHSTRSVLSVRRKRRVAQRAEPAEAEQHDRDAPGRERRQRERRRGSRRRAPATAPSATGNPSRGAAAAPIAPRATRADDRDGSPRRPRRAGIATFARRRRVLTAARGRSGGSAPAAGRRSCPRRAPTAPASRRAGPRADRRPRARAGGRARGGRRPRRRARPVRFVRASTRRRPRARTARADPGRQARGAPRRSLAAEPVQVDDERDADRRRAARARARRARRAARSSASGRAAPRRRETYGRTARTVSAPVPRRRRSAAGTSTRGRTGCTIAPAARGRGRDRDRRAAARRAAWRVRTKTPSGADVRSCTRTWSNTPRRVATCGMTPSAGDRGAPPRAGRIEHPHLDARRAPVAAVTCRS